MTKEIYIDILGHQVVLPSSEKLFSDYYIFMHDNDPRHASRSIKGTKKN